jgi:putative nucleotidyltransferase with HDIG domain
MERIVSVVGRGLLPQRGVRWRERTLKAHAGWHSSVWRVVGDAIGVLDRTDPFTAQHCIRVSLLSAALAGELGLPEAAVRLVRLGGLLHDIGKVRVPCALLTKPGPLTREEYCRVMRHTTIGAGIVAPLGRRFPAVVRIVRWHHERPDGRGQPDGLAGEAIPLEARIVAVADAFDAMTQPRPYRPQPAPPAQALLEIESASGTQFDAACAGALRRGWTGAASAISAAVARQVSAGSLLASLLRCRRRASVVH